MPLLAAFFALVSCAGPAPTTFDPPVASPGEVLHVHGTGFRRGAVIFLSLGEDTLPLHDTTGSETGLTATVPAIPGSWAVTVSQWGLPTHHAATLPTRLEILPVWPQCDP
jgi:hypothetical protein